MKTHRIFIFATSLLFLAFGCSKKPDFAAANKYFEEAFSCYLAGNYKSALESFNKAIDSNPNFAKAYLWRGLTRRRMHGSGSIPVAGGHLGTLIIGSGDFNKATKIDPNYAEAYFYRAKSYESAKFYKKAIEDYEKATELIESGLAPREILPKVKGHLDSLKKRCRSGLKGWDN